MRTPRPPADARHLTESEMIETYEAISSYVKEHGYPPTMRELGEALGLTSTSSRRCGLWNRYPCERKDEE